MVEASLDPLMQQKRLQELESAFVEFARMSEGLEASYQALQVQVSDLTEELAAARSERLRHLQEKEQIANQLARLLDALPGGVVVLDQQGEIQTMNPAAQLFFEGISEGQQWEQVLEQQLGQDDPVLEKDLVLRSGRVLERSSSRSQQDEGEILLFSDVTETRKLQHNLNQNRRLASMGEMAASLAHQVRTPLAAALLYISHLEKESLDKDKRLKIAGKLRSRLHHLNGLVKDMLHYARGGSAGNEEIDIEGFVDVLQQTLEEEIKNSLKGAFTVELMAGQESRFVGNRDALLTAIQNLVNNAIDVTEGEVNIIFRLQVLDEEWVQIEVEDDGPGIPKEMQEQIFEPFYTSRARGTGLGLAVVQAVADAHGGEVWVKSALGEGASFGMRIPAAPPAAVVG
ncbi:MAG: PAS domain-containing protein [Gammaproteobacteria bacterium]|nr:PAS domain-containing protein [Gammaproteobacteria bacterium]MBT3490604.1 PAS domain-containing protein [Gammaproteobacteria bacterium]MBT3718044.1 PAS domain-containing protein [Gammaproteobacteria bacterium]MBT3844871.1 PAS domain-containing protein [Gammaproteobacteria bacterium]MBT3891988.1 PAS domain-containing protein [Gammaproteobacteria bacterium]